MRYREYCQKGLYRSRSGLLFGVCRGVGDYFDISTNGIRLLVLLGFIFTGFWPVGVLYLLAALLMKPEPRFIDW
jgi:phage shock protein C